MNPQTFLSSLNSHAMRKRLLAPLRVNLRPSMCLSLCLSLCLGLGACGFHLRGQVGMPQALQQMALEVPALSNALEKEIKRNLESSGVEVFSGAATILRISNENTQKRTASISSNARAGEYALDYSFHYELIIDEQQQRANTLKISRSYVFDLNNLSAMSQEESLLKSEMRRDLVQRLLRELSRTSLVE